MDSIRFENISYKYLTEKNIAVSNLSFSLQKGKLTAIIGPNGSGKTTVCNIIRGFIPNFFPGDLEGNVYIEGKNIKDLDYNTLGLKIGFVFQNPFVQISGSKDTVFDEVAFGLENIGRPIDEIYNVVNNTLKLVNIEHLKDNNPLELSGGQKQRVALASIIAMDPDIYVIDEPTSQLDPQGTEKIFEIIKLLKKENKTIILVEHKIELIAEYADYLLVLNNGELIKEGTPREVLADRSLLEKNIDVPEYTEFGFKLIDENFPIKNIPIDKKETINLVSNLIDDSH